jgi:haloalkane dehalogenase
VFPYPRSGQVFCDLIPGAGEQVRIEGAAHFLQEDRGEQVAAKLLEFMGRS